MVANVGSQSDLTPDCRLDSPVDCGEETDKKGVCGGEARNLGYPLPVVVETCDLVLGPRMSGPPPQSRASALSFVCVCVFAAGFVCSKLRKSETILCVVKHMAPFQKSPSLDKKAAKLKLRFCWGAMRAKWFHAKCPDLSAKRGPSKTTKFEQN